MCYIVNTISTTRHMHARKRIQWGDGYLHVVDNIKFYETQETDDTYVDVCCSQMYLDPTQT